MPTDMSPERDAEILAAWKQAEEIVGKTDYRLYANRVLLAVVKEHPEADEDGLPWVVGMLASAALQLREAGYSMEFALGILGVVWPGLGKGTQDAALAVGVAAQDAALAVGVADVAVPGPERPQ